MSGRFTYQNTWGAAAPVTTVGGGVPLLVANIFQFATAGFIVGLRFYRAANDNDEHIGYVMKELDNSGINTLLFPANNGATPVGWQHAYFGRRVPVLANTPYYIVVSFGARRQSYTDSALTGASVTVGDITVPADTADHWNGISGAGFARDGWAHQPGTRYGVDCLFLKEGALG